MCIIVKLLLFAFVSKNNSRNSWTQFKNNYSKGLSSSVQCNNISFFVFGVFNWTITFCSFQKFWTAQNRFSYGWVPFKNQPKGQFSRRIYNPDLGFRLKFTRKEQFAKTNSLKMVFSDEYQTELFPLKIFSDLSPEIRKNIVVQKWDENTWILSYKSLKLTRL